MFIANIDGKEVELKADQLKPKEGYGVITPDNVPDGYFTESAFQAKIKDRLERAKDDTRKALSDDPDFHKNVLGRYGIQLSDDGKPKGIKTVEDVEKMKLEVAEQIKAEYDATVGKLKASLDGFKSKGLTDAIVSGANKIGIDGKYLEPLVEGGSPYLVKELGDRFAWNDEVKDYVLKDTDDTFAVDGSGFVTTQKFFEKNQEKFKHMLKDQRQRGSNFAGQGNAGEGRPKGNPAEWDRSKKLAFISENGQEGYKKALNDYKSGLRASVE